MFEISEAFAALFDAGIDLVCDTVSSLRGQERSQSRTKGISEGDLAFHRAKGAGSRSRNLKFRSASAGNEVFPLSFGVTRVVARGWLMSCAKSTGASIEVKSMPRL